MPDCLIVVFWNPDEMYTRAATSLVFSREDTFDPNRITRHDGMSIQKFFERQSIPVKQAQRRFPGSIVFDHERTRKKRQPKPSWSLPLWKQSLPMSEAGLQPLADMIGMPVITYTYFRYRDSAPQPLFRIEPRTR